MLLFPKFAAPQGILVGAPDLNRGPPAPKAGALPGCATPRLDSIINDGMRVTFVRNVTELIAEEWGI